MPLPRGWSIPNRRNRDLVSVLCVPPPKRGVSCNRFPIHPTSRIHKLTLRTRRQPGSNSGGRFSWVSLFSQEDQGQRIPHTPRNDPKKSHCIIFRECDAAAKSICAAAPLSVLSFQFPREHVFHVHLICPRVCQIGFCVSPGTRVE